MDLGGVPATVHIVILVANRTLTHVIARSPQDDKAICHLPSNTIVILEHPQGAKDLPLTISNMDI